MSGVGELANAIQIITGAVQAVRLVYKAYEAIKDVNQQIRHLTSLCDLVGKNLNETLKLLHQRLESPIHQDESQLEYYMAISEVIRTVEKDLEEVQSRLPTLEKSPKIKMLGKVFRSRAYKAVDMAVTMNEKALGRIHAVTIQIQWATTNLWRYDQIHPHAFNQACFDGLRQLGQKVSSSASTLSPNNSGAMTPSLSDSEDPESKTREDEYQENMRKFNDSVFQVANSVIIKVLPSGSQTPNESWDIPRTHGQRSLPEPRLPETRVTAKELRIRFDKAKNMTELALKQEFPDAAAAFHSQALKSYEELCQGSELNISESTELESHHIGILIKCLQNERRMDGIERLGNLASKAERLADTHEVEPPELHRLRRDVGNLYLTLKDWDHAIRFFRLAIFEPGYLEDYPDNEADVKTIAGGIIQAYRASAQIIEGLAFRQILAEKLGRDPILEPQEYRDAIAWCRKWNFKMNGTSTTPCFTDEKDEEGDFPLHKAVCDPGVSGEVLRQLASDRNAINARGKRELTPLLMAVEQSRVEAVRVLLEEGASLDLRTPKRDMSETILHVCRDTEVMKLLLEKLQSRRPSVAPSILPQEDEGAEEPQRIDINSQDEYTGTALHCSCERDDWAMVKLLLDYDADPNAENYLHETPLILTCFNKGKRVTTKRIVRELVDHGANVDHKDDDQKHARDGLRQKGFNKSEIADLLEGKSLRSETTSLRRGGETDSTTSPRQYSVGSFGPRSSETSRDGSSLQT